VLTFQDVTREYRLDAQHSITPVNNVRLQVNKGDFVIITGRSGCGKTTLLNLAAGLVRPSAGSVTLADNDLNSMSDKQISKLRTETIGFVFQFPSLLPSLTIMENITLPGMFLSKAKQSGIPGRAAEILEIMHLSDKKNVYPRQLSAGEQKRVVVARSLINEPQIVLADEPTSDLDSSTEKEVMELLLGINARGVTFLMVTHSLSLIPFAATAYEMNNGILKKLNGAIA
jgi:putative ABC transport system ATP-binding protein